ncbi:IS66 family transposase [Aquibaculum arenosum]|uniref:IS66 family transposase n=1 Tax=Aquibaculum arenosum TaxID=3032591 RepID=A0ABT5YRC2_9PROT|nr:IS66 family transposase [Fodinicurvata sp. CAU 1616]MDF2097532.1 IS66 family transposase [Fodinicurvata sp. CAU 1616]
MENSPAAIAELQARLAAEQARADAAEAQVAQLTAQASSTEALIVSLKLQIEKLRRELYGQRSERKARLLGQLELELEELQATASEDELAAEQAAAKTTRVEAFERRRPARKPFPEHLPRERVVIPAPETCEACGSDRLSRLGETVTETLEVIPRQWKVVQTVREKVSCRCCARISQPPAPFHVVARGWAGPSLLAMILFEKYGQHQPLNRQSERYAREGVELSLSTLADQVGACAHALQPLHALIAKHVLAAERLHGDDTPVPVLAKGKTRTARAWVYVRDDTPFGGSAAPAALFRYSRDRSSDHPVEHLERYGGILQADAYAGYKPLYERDSGAGAVTEALCWSHARRKFYELADLARKRHRGSRAPPSSPLALEAVKRIDALFDIERAINGLSAEERRAIRQEQSRPLVEELESWMREERAGLSRNAEVAKAMNYMLKRWEAFTRFLDDGRICLTNNAAERALRGLALGRKSWLFAGSDRGGQRAAVIYTLIVTAKMNDVDPQAWLADVLARIAEIPQTRLHELLPWHWKANSPAAQAA